MELKLENNLVHQTMPVDGVAAVVEASIQEPAKQSHQLSQAGLTIGNKRIAR